MTTSYPRTVEEWRTYISGERQTLVNIQKHFQEHGTIKVGFWEWLHSALDDDLAHKEILVRTREALDATLDRNSNLVSENADLKAEIADLKSKATSPYPYPEEKLGENDDDGTMVENVEYLRSLVVGHKIVAVEKPVTVPTDYKWGSDSHGTALVLDNGKRVVLVDGGDCCAYTELEDVILNLDKIDHVITGVGTTDGYNTWHIYADLGDVATLKVGWSCGNPFYYGYGFAINVLDEEGNRV